MPVALTGPQPVPAASYPLGFCAVCAAGWKAEAVTAAEAQIKAAEADGDPSRLHQIRLASRGLPAPAVAYGLVTLPLPPGTPAPPGAAATVPLPLCWTHLPAIHFTASAIAPMPASALPQGAVLLDGSR